MIGERAWTGGEWQEEQERVGPCLLVVCARSVWQVRQKVWKVASADSVRSGRAER